MKIVINAVFLSLFLLTSSAYASHKIKVMALFTNKAMLTIDGKQKLLKKNQSYQGVKLISADSDGVVLLLHGQKKKFKLGREISTSYKKADQGKELVVWKDARNMFRIHGSINNFSIHFLIDSGASSVALNSVEAKRMGLKFKKGLPVQATTASGVTRGYAVTLDKVKIGHITLYNVQAVVLQGSFPKDVLLGQSFLSRIHMTRNGDKMKLKKQF